MIVIPAVEPESKKYVYYLDTRFIAEDNKHYGNGVTPSPAKISLCPKTFLIVIPAEEPESKENDYRRFHDALSSVILRDAFIGSRGRIA